MVLIGGRYEKGIKKFNCQGMDIIYIIIDGTSNIDFIFKKMVR